MNKWTLFPACVVVKAEDEAEAIARAKNEIQQQLTFNTFEFEDIIDEGEDDEIN